MKLILENINQEDLNNLIIENTVSTFVLTNSKIYTIPENLFPDSIISIKITATKLKNISRNTFNLPNLEELNLFDNHIENVGFRIPNKLTMLNLSYNMINNIEIDSNNLEHINLEYNKLTNIPNCLNNNGNLIKKLGYNDLNVFKPRLNQNNGHMENDFFATMIANNYRLNNNVHTNHIQDVTRRAIENLMNLDKPINNNWYKEMSRYYIEKETNIFKYVMYKFITIPVMTLLYRLTSSNYTFIYDYSNNATANYSQIIERIWAFSKNRNDIDDIMENFRIQVNDGVGYCNVGQVTRIINTLASFTDIIVYEQPINVRLGNKITEIRKRYKELYEEDSDEFLEKCRIEFEEFMDNLEISPEEKAVWLEPLNV